MAERKVIVLTGADGNDYDVRDEEAQQSIITIGNEIGSVPSGKTLQGQIDAINNGIGSVPSGKTVEGQISDLETNKVPTTRKVNNKALSSDVNLVGSDIPVSALDSTKLDVAITDLKSAIGTVPEGKNLQGEVDELQTVKAEKDGAYEDLTAGNALYLLSDRGDTDVAPYVFRKTGGAKNGYGREFLRKIVGGTVVWNQLVQNGNFASASGWSVVNGTFTVSGYVAILTATGTATQFYRNISIVDNHIYLSSVKANHSQSDKQISLQGAVSSKSVQSVANTWLDISYLGRASTTGSREINMRTSATSGDTIKYKEFVIFDLTQMFGSTVADAIYAIEGANIGDGIKLFRSLFHRSYYDYDAGSLQSVQAKEHRTVGFNLWDEQWENCVWDENNNGIKREILDSIGCKNPIRIVGGATYYLCAGNGSFYVLWYDANMNLISYSLKPHDSTYEAPSNATYLTFYSYNSYGTTYKNDICINLSDPAKNRQYEPYIQHVYPLDSSLTLRGIPKWDSTNGLYYDGDEHKPDGSVKRKYAEYTITGNETINITSATPAQGKVFYVNLPNDQPAYRTLNYYITAVCTKFMMDLASLTRSQMALNTCKMYGDGSTIDFCVSADTVDEFKAIVVGTKIVYEVNTPTTEQAEPFRELQISAHGGTEEFIDAGVTASTPTRDVCIPVGTETFYPVDIWHLIDELTALVLEN